MNEESCLYCHESVYPGEIVGPAVYSMTGELCLAHQECGLRMVLGGIGHFEDHGFWCGVMRDPDAGLTWRESARRVRMLVDRVGMQEAVRLSSRGDDLD